MPLRFSAILTYAVWRSVLHTLDLNRGGLANSEFSSSYLSYVSILTLMLNRAYPLVGVLLFSM